MAGRGLAMASVLLCVVTLLVLPVIIIRLPAGYFHFWTLTVVNLQHYYFKSLLCFNKQ